MLFFDLSVQNDGPELQIHLPNNGFRMIRFNESSDVRHILNSILMSIAPDQKINPLCYALRLRHTLTQEIIWLSPDTTMMQVMAHISNPMCANSECPNLDKSQVMERFGQLKSNSSSVHSSSVWRAELRVRYVPKDLRELYETDPRTCHYYFDQVKQDYIQSNSAQVDQDTAIQLCCLSIRHYYKEVKEPSDKKNHVDYIEKERGFSNFIPKSVIDSIKQKNLKKLIQTGYKKVYNFSEPEYMLKFFDLLRPHFQFEQERFLVTLSTGWNIEIDLIIGPHFGISYLKNANAEPTKVADFQDVVRIATSILPGQAACTSAPSTLLSASTTNGTSDQPDVTKKTAQSPLPHKKLLKSSKFSLGSNSSNSSSVSSTLNNSAQSSCSCADLKTQLKIKVSNNDDDLSIACNGIKVRSYFIMP